MTKAELISKVAEKTGDTKAAAGRIIDFIRDTAVASLLLDDRFVYPGFGIFTTKTRGAYTGRNPKTGEPAKVPAKTSVKFKMAKDLKEAVNK